MPTHELPGDSFVTTLEEAFAGLIEAGEVDVVVDQAAAEFDVQADSWTLHLEGSPPTTGFLALDDEPVTHRERLAALDAALDGPALAAMRHLNRELGGGLIAVLANSGDALTALLIGVLDDSGDHDLLDSLCD